MLNGPVNATLNSQSPETLALNAATGNIALQGAVGNSLALGALTASGANISLQDVTTTGNQSYTGAVTLWGAATTITTNGGAIVFNGPVNALNSASPETLALNAATGNINCKAMWAIRCALGALTASGANISLQDVTTTGDQTYTGAVTLLGSATTITTNGGAIVFNGPVNALNRASPRNIGSQCSRQYHIARRCGQFAASRRAYCFGGEHQLARRDDDRKSELHRGSDFTGECGHTP